VPSRNELYAGMEHKAPPRNAFASDRSAVLNSLASTLAFVPGVGDVAGLAADADMYATDPKSRNWKNYLLTGLGALPFVGGASLLGRATRNVPTGFGNQDGMITYHGSPHRINNVDEANPYGKFDTSKIGTGEGAQAYGHGLYLAENPDVARQYVGAGNPWFDTSAAMYGNKSIDDLYNAAQSRVDRLNRQGVKTTSDVYRRATAEHYFWENVMTHRHPQAAIGAAIEDADNWPELAEFAKQVNVDQFSGVPKGNFYTVDLPDEHIAKMLDWDAPLSEQPEAIRNAFPEWARTAFDPEGPRPDITPTLTGGEVYRKLAAKVGADKASEVLRQAGLPGIRYLDGGSRGAGQGTRNFVIFDGDTAKILKRE
jgi:hypothetical protein